MLRVSLRRTPPHALRDGIGVYRDCVHNDGSDQEQKDQHRAQYDLGIAPGLVDDIRLRCGKASPEVYHILCVAYRLIVGPPAIGAEVFLEADFSPAVLALQFSRPLSLRNRSHSENGT